MKIVKYLIIAVILFGLYVTEPLWRAHPNSSNAEVSQIDKKMNEQQDEHETLVAEEAEKLRKLEEKFGKKPTVRYKSRVPKPLQDHWDKTLKSGAYVYEDICSPLRASSNGWKTTCQYKIRNENGSSSGLQFDTYVIKNGKLLK